MLHIKFHKCWGSAVKGSAINAVFLFVFICYQLSLYADLQAEDYMYIMSNSGMKLKWQSVYPFENKSKCKSNALRVVYLCNQGSKGPGEADSSSSTSSQQSTSHQISKFRYWFGQGKCIMWNRQQSTGNQEDLHFVSPVHGWQFSFYSQENVFQCSGIRHKWLAVYVLVSTRHYYCQII